MTSSEVPQDAARVVSLEEPTMLRSVQAAVSAVDSSDYAEVHIGQDPSLRSGFVLLDVSCHSLRYQGSSPDRREISYSIEQAGLLALHAALGAAIAQAQRDGLVPAAAAWPAQ